MGFKFDYKNEEELELAFKRLHPGEIQFMIKAITDSDRQGYTLMNSKGNPYLRVTLVAIDAKGQKGLLDDNISANAAWKIHDLCHAVGRPDLYDAAGDLDFHKLIGLQGGAIIEDRQYTKNDGSVAVVSSIATYLARDAQQVVEKQEVDPMKGLESDIPWV